MIKQLPYQQKVVARNPITVTNVVKGNEVRMKDGLCEVRSIFQRVDNAFKKRKEENEVLALAVSDLENHLSYLENQTQDQITATTALNLTLSSTQKNVNEASDAAAEFGAKSLEELSGLVGHVGAATGQAETSVETMRSNLGCLSKIKENMDGEALALLSELEEYVRSAAEQMRAVEELETAMSQKETALKDARDKLADQKLQQEQLRHSITESQNALPGLKSTCEDRRVKLEETRRAQVLCAQQTEELKQQRASLECAADARRTAFATQTALRDEEIAALSSKYADTCSLRNARYQVLQDMQKQHSEQESLLAQRRDTLRTLEQTQREKAQQLQEAQEEVQRLRESHTAAVAEHGDARDASLKAQQFNEQQYELTCLRMTQLRELQQQQCSLAQDLHAARWKLSVAVEELRGRVQDQKAATAQALAQSQMQRAEAEKSSAELQRVREQRQGAQEALRREEALLRDLDAETAALTAKREEQARNAECRAALNLTLAAREDELRQLREANEARTKANEAAAQELASSKTAVAEAKAKLKGLKKHGTGAGAAALDAAQLPDDLSAQLQTEVDQGVRQMREALDAQNAAEVAEINQCLKKLASGFPDPAAADSELQEKETMVVRARQDLEVMRQQLADKQYQEEERRRAEEEQRRAEEELRRVAEELRRAEKDRREAEEEWRRQKERDDEAEREKASRTMEMEIEDPGPGFDEFVLFERVASESPRSRTVQERSVQVLSCGGMNVNALAPLQPISRINVGMAAFEEMGGGASPTEQNAVRLQRQLTPQLPTHSTGPSRWELSEPATRLPPFLPEPSDVVAGEGAHAGRFGASMLHAESDDPPPRDLGAPQQAASQSSQSQRLGKKKKRRGKRGKTPPSSAASSLDLLKPQPSLSLPFPPVLVAPPARPPPPPGLSGNARGVFVAARPGQGSAAGGVRNEQRGQQHRQPQDQLEQAQVGQALAQEQRRPSAQQDRAPRVAKSANRPAAPHAVPTARPADVMGPPRMQPSASAGPRKSFVFPAMPSASAQQLPRKSKSGGSGGGGARKIPSPGDWFAEDAPF